jgi:hypothetical protein
MEATPLRSLSSVAFSLARVWAGPVRCDEDANIFFLVVPELDPRDAKNAPAPPRYTKTPCDILGVSADAKKTTHFNPSSVTAFADADEVTTVATALDATGTLLALVWVRRGESGNQYIVPFDKSGGHRSVLKLDPLEMIVQGFEVFGSGEFLLRGRRVSPDGPRAAVMSGGGSTLRDVVGLPIEALDDPTQPPGLDHMVRGGDGRIYFAAHGEESVYAVGPSGDSELALRLVPAARNRRLVDLKAAGPRLAAIYYEERSGGGRSWMEVYDIALGERVGVYGPATGWPVCYEYSGSQDRFTFLRDGNSVVQAAP